MKIAYIGGFISTQHAADAIRHAFNHFGVDVTLPEHPHGQWTLSVPVDWDSVPDPAVAKEEAADKVSEAFTFVTPLVRSMGCTLNLRWHPTK